MKKISSWLMPSLLATVMLFGILAVIPLSTHAHDGEDHSEEVVSDDVQIAQMQALIELLQQLLEMLIEQRGGDMSDMHDDDHGDDHDNAHDDMHDEDDMSHDYTELYITVEEHGGVTHVHVYEPEMDEVKFFLEDIELTDTAGVIAGIVGETGLSEEEVEAAVVFKNDDDHDDDNEDDHDEHEEDDHDDDHGDDDEYEGIHIMNDGTIMLGNGDIVADATITEDGMIELSDGTLLEPEYDLR